MKLLIEIVGLLHIPGFDKTKPLEVADELTISGLYKQLGIIRDHQRFIIPFINDTEVNNKAKISQGDKVKLFLPTGGG